MAGTHHAPKQWCLGKEETVESLEDWKHNLICTLSLDPLLAPFLQDGAAWLKKTRASPTREFMDDPVETPANNALYSVPKGHSFVVLSWTDSKLFSSCLL